MIDARGHDPGTIKNLIRPIRPSVAALRLNAVCPWFTMFPLSFPLSQLARRGSVRAVLDPFCGRGTTLFAARLLGVPAFGIDVDPLAVAISRAKLASASSKEVIDECRQLLMKKKKPKQVPDGEFWRLCFHTDTLQQLCVLREGLLELPRGQVRTLLRSIILGILHGPRYKGPPGYLSNQMPRTYSTKPGPAVKFWKKRRLKPPEVDVLDVVERRARFVLEETPPRTEGQVLLGDSRRLDTILNGHAEMGFDYVITSPPYPGMRTYGADQWLRRWFLGGRPHPDYNQDGHLGGHEGSSYADELAKVWKQVAAVCRQGARLVVRYGAMASSPEEPRETLLESLSRSGASWRVLTIVDAGTPSRARRQATQFTSEPARPRSEIDLHAVLEA
jgi:SAM-dependent methyltransferase